VTEAPVQTKLLMRHETMTHMPSSQVAYIAYSGVFLITL